MGSNGARMIASRIAGQQQRADKNDHMTQLRGDRARGLAGMRRPQTGLRQMTTCSSIMKTANSGFDKPLNHTTEMGPKRQPSRLFKKPRAMAAHCHFLFGPGADVVQRNRSLQWRTKCRMRAVSVRGRREMPLAWRAPKLR
jgi:hypothetical protein